MRVEYNGWRIKSFVLNKSRLSSARADPIRGTGGENLPLLTPDTFTEPHTEASQHAIKGLGQSDEPSKRFPAALKNKKTELNKFFIDIRPQQNLPDLVTRCPTDQVLASSAIHRTGLPLFFLANQGRNAACKPTF